MRRLLLVLLVLIAVVNLGLSFYIQDQKLKAEAEAETPENCFIEGSGCYTVQTSYFATTFGVSNPIYGIVAFPLIGLIAFWQLFSPARWRTIAGYAILVPGALFSLWLLHVQFLRLHATCVYCLWVDGLTLLALVIWAWLYRDETKQGLAWLKRAVY